jgi:hypothetical protein
MRAAVALRVDENNPLSALELREGWPTPVVGPSQTRIRLAATTVNVHDLWGSAGWASGETRSRGSSAATSSDGTIAVTK